MKYFKLQISMRKKIIIFKNIFIFIILFFLLISCVINENQNQDNVKNWVAGYYVGYQHGKAEAGKSQQNPDEINYKYLTHIMIGIALAKNDGSLDLRFYHNTESEGLAWASQTILEAHKYNCKALLMIGGEGNGDEIKNAMRDYKEIFISNIVNTVKNYNFDGVDLDWEDYIEDNLFIELVKELRRMMPDKIISVPGFPLNINFNHDLSRILAIEPYINQYNIMSYHPGTTYIGSGWWSWHNCPLDGAKPNTPISIKSTFEILKNAGFPASKLGMGIAFYAIGYSGGITGPNQPTEWGSNQIKGGDNIFPIWKLFNSAGTQLRNQYRNWDNNAKVPYLLLPSDIEMSEAPGCRYISYDDEQSIYEKGRFARANGYGGIIIWTLSQGYVAENPVENRDPLLKALYEAFVLGR